MTKQPEPKGGVLTALHAVMEKVGYVQKSGENKFHHYKYAGEGDLLKVLRPAMVEAGLLLIPSVSNLSDIDQYGNVNVTMEYTLAHKDGEVWPEKITIIGTGNDKNSKGGVGDKGTYKAMTGANKYLLFKLFQIETGDDPEKTEADAPKPGNRGAKLHGPLKVMELKEKMRAFAGDLAAVTDGDELIVLLNSYQDVLDQCQRDLPDWWFGDGGDIEGVFERIEARRKAIADAESTRDGLAAE